MPRTITQQLLDDRLGQSLDDWIAQRRPPGSDTKTSWHRIVIELRDATGILVTGQTLNNWYGHLDKQSA